MTTLRLGRLDETAVALLAAACVGGDPIPADALEVLLAKAEGLPVLVEELLAGLLEPGRGAAPVPVPPTLAGLVARRMASLDESARLVLQAVAVFGTEPDWTLLAVVSGPPTLWTTGAGCGHAGVMTGSRQPAFFVGGGPLTGHSVVEIGPDGRPPSLLRVLVTQGPLLRIEGKTLSSGMRTYGLYQLSDDGDDRSLIYEFVGEEFE